MLPSLSKNLNLASGSFSPMATALTNMARLPPADGGPSFEELSYSVTTDVHPRAVLGELQRLALAELDERDRVRLTAAAYVPHGDRGGMLAMLADNVGDHLDAAGVPVLSPRDRPEAAGIVVAGIPGRAAEAHAALADAGITATLHGEDRLRLSVHATTRSAAFPQAAAVLATFA